MKRRLTTTAEVPCVVCDRTDRIHKAKGVCTRCYRKAIYKAHRDNEKAKPKLST